LKEICAKAADGKRHAANARAIVSMYPDLNRR
jgi:hypothetical protein